MIWIVRHRPHCNSPLQLRSFFRYNSLSFVASCDLLLLQQVLLSECCESAKCFHNFVRYSEFESRVE